MTGLLLSPRHTPDSQRLWRAAIDSGWDVERISGHEWAESSHRTCDPAEVVLYGESMFVTSMADRLGLELTQPADDALVGLPFAWTRRQIRLMPLDRARDCPLPAFVKPAGDKAFAAKVYRSAFEFRDASSWAPGDMPVLVSEPVVFGPEYRMFVADQSVEAASIYMRDGLLVEEVEAPGGERADAIAFASEVARTVDTPAYVVDVGFIENVGWAVVEFNPCWASGLCQSDPRNVLRVLRRAMRPKA